MYRWVVCGKGKKFGPRECRWKKGRSKDPGDLCQSQLLPSWLKLPWGWLLAAMMPGACAADPDLSWDLTHGPHGQPHLPTEDLLALRVVHAGGPAAIGQALPVAVVWKKERESESPMGSSPKEQPRHPSVHQSVHLPNHLGEHRDLPTG